MRRRLAVVATALAALTACGNGPGPGPIPQPGAPQITCGGAITIENITGLAQDVSYGAPVTSAGAPPVSVACTPPSGSPFTLGETPVNCTATDALGRQATCAFTVTVRHKPLAIT